MHRPPTQGVEGAKPRISPAANGRVSKEELSQLSREYLVSRNRTQAAKAQAAEVANAEKAGTLMSKRMVRLEVAFLLSAFRQKVHVAPAEISRKVMEKGGIEPGKEHALEWALREYLSKLLVELASLPEKLNNPRWQEQIDADLQVDGAREARQTPTEAKVAQAKAEQRRARKTATMRTLRS